MLWTKISLTLHDSDCLRSNDYVPDKIPITHVSLNDLTSLSNPNGSMSRLIGVNDFYFINDCEKSQSLTEWLFALSKVIIYIH
jgi:hypothetical protein